ncbi:MAG: endonuclease/exonuclease/phosphatase family protein [bacterium]
MKLISLNIELNKHRDLVLGFLKKEKSDVICLQEILEADFPIYKKELEMEGVLEMWYQMDSTRDSHHPELQGQKHGIAILTKKIIGSGLNYYNGSKENVIKPSNDLSANKTIQNNNVFLWIETENNEGERFKFITTHLPVTAKGETTDYQLKVVDLLIRELEKIPEFILCGDTNAPRGKEAFSRIAAKYKDNIPPEYETSLDQNLHRVKGLMYMVDGLFTTPSYKAVNVKLVDGVSDHMAIVANIEKA